MSAETRSFARPEVVGAMVRRQRPARLLRMLAGVDEGVYVLIPAVIAAIAGRVVSAWLFLTTITP